MSDPVLSERTRIQNYLVTLAKAGKFYAVSYDPATGLANVDLDTEIKPLHVQANERQSLFEIDPDMGRRLAERRRTWSFQMLLDFSQEIIIEHFERSLSDPVPVLPADPAKHFASAAIHLHRTSCIHPIQQQSQTGSHFDLAFEVVLGRI